MVIQIGLALRVNLPRILYNYLALKLSVIGSSTVHCYGFQNFKSGVVERFRRRYILYIVTAELQTANVAYFQRTNQLSGFSAYPDGSPSQLMPLNGVILYLGCNASYINNNNTLQGSVILHIGNI